MDSFRVSPRTCSLDSDPDRTFSSCSWKKKNNQTVQGPWTGSTQDPFKTHRAVDWITVFLPKNTVWLPACRPPQPQATYYFQGGKLLVMSDKYWLEVLGQELEHLTGRDERTIKTLCCWLKVKPWTVGKHCSGSREIWEGNILTERVNATYWCCWNVLYCEYSWNSPQVSWRVIWANDNGWYFKCSWEQSNNWHNCNFTGTFKTWEFKLTLSSNNNIVSIHFSKGALYRSSWIKDTKISSITCVIATLPQCQYVITATNLRHREYWCYSTQHNEKHDENGGKTAQ